VQDREQEVLSMMAEKDAALVERDIQI
jgi:hypothetical protein